jgi:hypothetical protein
LEIKIFSWNGVPRIHYTISMQVWIYGGWNHFTETPLDAQS